MPQTISDLVKMARHVIATEGLSTVKDVVPANRISYGNSPQKTVTPRIVLEVSGTTYSPTFDDDRKVRTYTVDYAVYSKSVAECTDIMERIQTVIRQHETGAANNGQYDAKPCARNTKSHKDFVNLMGLRRNSIRG